MDCACVFNKICGYGYYEKGVYIQVIRSTARQYFRGQKHGPTHENVYIWKPNLQKTL